MIPIQAIDLTNWISRSYGLDPVAGGAFGNVWKCTYDDGVRCITVRTDVNRQWHCVHRVSGLGCRKGVSVQS